MYKIFKLSYPEFMQQKEHVAYGQYRDVNRSVLEEIPFSWKWDNNFTTFEEAKAFIIKNKDDYKHESLVILPVFQIDYEGNIKE